MKKNLTAILLFLIISLSSAGQINNIKPYQEAFVEQSQMLKEQRPISFKRAVFLTENAFYGGRLNYQTFCSDINKVSQQLKDLIKQRGFEKYKTAANWAVYTYMTDSIPINNYHPFSYDFVDFTGVSLKKVVL